MESYRDITVGILAGGLGTRIQSRYSDIPKALIPFEGRPFLDYLIRSFARYRPEEILVLTAHLHEQIEAEFKARNWDQLGVRLVNEGEPHGTGNGARLLASETSSQYLLLCNGDTVLQFDLALVAHKFRKFVDCGCDCMAILTGRTGVPNEGAVHVSTADDRVVEFDEERKLSETSQTAGMVHLSSTGTYLFRIESLRSLCQSSSPASLERDILPQLSRSKRMFAFDNGQGFFNDFGEPDRLLFLEENPSLVGQVYRLSSVSPDVEKI